MVNSARVVHCVRVMNERLLKVLTIAYASLVAFSLGNVGLLPLADF